MGEFWNNGQCIIALLVNILLLITSEELPNCVAKHCDTFVHSQQFLN